MASPQITGAFSPIRHEILSVFANLPQPQRSKDVKAAWSHFYNELQGARGTFVCGEDECDPYEIPGDQDFDGKGFLRCWLSSRHLYLTQNRSEHANFSYGSPIFCDTNFVSYCEAFVDGRDLGALDTAFKDAVNFLLPIADSTCAWPYMMESMESPNREKVHATLRAFALFKLSDPEIFKKESRFSADFNKADKIAQGCLDEMSKEHFKLLYGHVKRRFLWTRVILLKSVIINISSPQSGIAKRMETLLEFLHQEMHRIPGELYMAYRYFEKNTKEEFFSGMQKNARGLDAKLKGMAWDLTHWRTLFEMITVDAINHETKISFPIPHFLSFDRKRQRTDLTRSA